MKLTLCLIFIFSPFVFALSQNEANTIDLKMKFAVQLEQLSTKQVKTSSIFKYHPLNILFPAAFAQLNNERLCIYAGWLSYIPTHSNGSTPGSCKHPSQYNAKEVPSELSSLIAEEHKKYLSLSSSCNNSQDIVCNPLIFGADGPKHTPTCVEGNANSKNSSFACLQNFERKSAADKATVRNYIHKLNENPLNAKRSKQYLELIDDACLCDGRNGKISRAYAKRMFKTQTCFAWVAQLRNLGVPGCYPTATNPTEDLTKLSGDLAQKAESEFVVTNITAAEYTKIINNPWKNQSWAGQRKDYGYFCEAVELEKKDLPEAVVLDNKLSLKGTEEADPENNKNSIVTGVLGQLQSTSGGGTITYTKDNWSFKSAAGHDQGVFKDTLKSNQFIFKKEATAYKVEITYTPNKVEGINSKLTAEVLIPALTDPEITHKIEIELGELKDNKYSINAKVEIDGELIDELPDGYSINWYKKAKKPEAKNEDKDGLEVVQAAKKGTPKTEEATLIENTTEMVINVSPEQSTQEIEAKLVKDEEEVADSEELEIEAKKPLPQAIPNQQGGMPSIQRIKTIFQGNR